MRMRPSLAQEFSGARLSQDGTIRLYEPEVGRLLYSITPPSDPASDTPPAAILKLELVVTEEGCYRLLSSDARGTVLVWDLGPAPRF
jgi:WD40 repeat protein